MKPGMCADDNSHISQSLPSFGVGHSIVSHTNETAWMAGSWLGDFTGSSSCFTIIDTPGIGDTQGRDCKQGALIGEQTKKLQPIDAFVLIFKGTDSRFTKPLQDRVSEVV